MELPRGMRDIEDDEFEKIEHLRDKFIDTAQLYDFEFFEPSPLELLTTLETKSGPSIKDEIYYFKDKGDREVALRFDFTMGVTRYVTSQKSLKLPAKLASFGGVFRYDEPQKGRYRFFHQWNTEIFGKSSLESDAELVDFTSTLFSNLNLQKIILEVSSRKLIESFVTNVFQSRDPVIISEVFRAMDKVQKKRREDILNEYEHKGLAVEKLEKILDFSQIKGTPDEIESQHQVDGLQGWSQLKKIFDALKNRQIKNARINFGIVRGLDYYSDFVFEAYDMTSDIGALAGGGRYDTLPNAFGRDDIGAAGVAGGIERIINSLEYQGIVKQKQSKIISILYATEVMQSPAMALTSKLRRKGFPVRIDLTGRQLKKQMEAATNSKHAIIFGPNEYQEKKVVLRNMQDRTEKKIPIDEILDNAKNLLY